MSGKSDRDQQPATRLANTGRDRDLTGPFINPPVIRASTVLFDSAADLAADNQRYTYGRAGTPTTEALATAISELHGAAGTVACPSGLSACTTALLATLSAGDEVLMVDSVYYPTRRAAEKLFRRFGVTTRYVDPGIGAEIADLVTPATRAIYLESPGSYTLDMQDLPAIAGVAKARDLIVLCDNTWATPLGCRPLDLGADIVVEAATKYIAGHSDASIGTVSANSDLWPRLRDTHRQMGLYVGPDDVFLTLRGLRTLGVRLDRHASSGLEVARWLQRRSEIERVLYPPLPDDPGHALWKRDMTGAAGLLGFRLRDRSVEAAQRFIDALRLFGIGWSWGGYESLVAYAEPARYRALPTEEGPIVRLSIGLEDPGDLIADLDQAFAGLSSDG